MRYQLPLGGEVAVLSVIKVDDAQQTVTSNLFLDFIWQDNDLVWDVSLFQGVTTISVPKEELWTPGIFIPNALDNGDIMSNVKQVYVSSNGTVRVTMNLLTETVCPMDLSRFPFDRQDCTIVFWNFNNFDWQFLATRSNSRLGAYLSQSNDWQVLNVSAQLVQNLGRKMLHTVHVTISLRRLSTYYTVCLVLPMVLTSYMNTLVFLLPLQAGEKISYLVTLSVSTSVFIGFFSTVMPRGLDDVPSTLKLLIGVIVQSLLVLLASIVVLRRHHHETIDDVQSSDDVLTAHAPCISDDAIQSRDSIRKSKSGCAINSPDGLMLGNQSYGADQRSRLICRFRLTRVSALGLDHTFFALAFLSNTIFLVVLLVQSLS